MKIIFGHQYADWCNYWDLIRISHVVASDFNAIIFCLLGFYMEIWMLKKKGK